MSQIDYYLRTLMESDASDLHFVAGQPPRMRVYGELTTIEENFLTQDKTQEILFKIMPTKATQEFEDNDSADFAYSVEGLARFRVNIMRHLGGVGGVFRAIPN